MATMASSGNLISMPVSQSALTQQSAEVSVARRRKISPEAGRAIEILGHAIEYLADEFALDCMSSEARAVFGSRIGAGLEYGSDRRKHPRIEAIELLKSFNREIYLSCPQVPTLRERLRSGFGLSRKKA